MTVTRKEYDGDITFLCDGRNGCNAELETDFKDFRLASELMKSEGWVFRRAGNRENNVWKHYCEDCAGDH